MSKPLLLRCTAKAEVGPAGQHVVRGFPYPPDYPALLYYPAVRDPGSWGIGCSSINYITLLSGATAVWPLLRAWASLWQAPVMAHLVEVSMVKFPKQLVDAASRRLLTSCALLVLAATAVHAQQVTGTPGSPGATITIDARYLTPSQMRTDGAY